MNKVDYIMAVIGLVVVVSFILILVIREIKSYRYMKLPQYDKKYFKEIEIKNECGAGSFRIILTTDRTNLEYEIRIGEYVCRRVDLKKMYGVDIDYVLYETIWIL